MSERHGFPVEIPFVSDVGLEAQSIEGGHAVITLRVEPRHCNSFQVAHGGAILTLMDAAMAMAARSLLRSDADDGSEASVDGNEVGMVTIEMKTTFMQPGTGLLTAHGNCVHRTRSMAFCEAEIRDERDALIGRASGSFKFVRQRGRAPQN